MKNRNTALVIDNGHSRRQFLKLAWDPGIDGRRVLEGDRRFRSRTNS